MKKLLIVGLMLSAAVSCANDSTRTILRTVRNATDIPYVVYRRCHSVTKGAGEAQVYYAGEAGTWQPMLTVLAKSEGSLGDPFGLKGVVIKDPYLQGCQLKIAPACEAGSNLPAFYIRHGSKVSGQCSSRGSFGPYLIEVSRGKDFEESTSDIACAANITVTRYCGEEEAFLGISIEDIGISFFEENNAELVDARDRKSLPLRITRLAPEQRDQSLQQVAPEPQQKTFRLPQPEVKHAEQKIAGSLNKLAGKSGIQPKRGE